MDIFLLRFKHLLAFCIAFVLCAAMLQSTSTVIASVTGTGSAYFAFDGYNQAFGNYTSSEGIKVLESANVPTDSFALEKGKELAIDTGIAITGAAAIKGLGYAGNKVLASNSAQKVKSVLFKSKTETNVATKPTTSKLTTTPDSSHLYDSGHSPRIGISAIDGKDRRVHEVLGGYGENISAKDFKLQVQAEKALDAHAKKTASGAGKSSTTSKGEVSGIGGKADALNKQPYDSRAMETMLTERNPGQKITSNTLPKTSGKNVKLAGGRHPKSEVVYNQKGFPVFDNIALFDTRISNKLALTKNAEILYSPTNMQTFLNSKNIALEKNIPSDIIEHQTPDARYLSDNIQL